MSVRRRSRWVVAVLCALLGTGALAVPARAAEPIRVTAAGPTPAVLQVLPGEKISFVVEGDPVDRLQSTSGNWQFDSCVTILLCPRTYEIAAPAAPGTYTYKATRAGAVRPGTVVVAAPPAAPPPPPPPPPAGAVPPKPGAPGAAQPPPGAGGTGRTALPPLPGGFGPVQQPGGPAPGGFAPAPTLALPLLPEAAAGPLPATAPPPGLGPLTNLAVAGDLPGQPTMRRYGLPAALAAVLAAGVLSLLLRLLLSEPAAGPGRTRSGPVAAVD